MVRWLNHPADGAAIKGSLDQQHLIKLLPVERLLAGFSGQLGIDLSGVERIDSAGMAFLLELKQVAAQTELEVSFHGSTDSLNKLKSLYNLEHII